MSEKGIENAKQRGEKVIKGEFHFVQGSIEYLQNIDNSYFDTIILSNIIDNLYPDDSKNLMREAVRVLKYNGKVLVKLNSYITKEEIIELNIKVIKDNLLDDGLILLNKTTEEWKELFNTKFNIKLYEEIYYPEYEQYNRMFWLTKRV